MTCKDCIFYDKLCSHALDESELVLCKDFKNKADFVEVVRCEKCIYRGIKFGHHFCTKFIGSEHSITLTDFCSYGERRDT